MAKSYSVGIVGESSYQEAIRGLREGERLTLEREPGNSHDARAIAVRDGDGQTIGYVPRDHWLTGALLDESKRARAIVERIEGGDTNRPSLGVVIEVELEGGASAPPPASPGAAAASAAERAAPDARLAKALGPGEADPKPSGPTAAPGKVKQGCATAVVVVLVLAVVGQCIGDGEKAPSPAPEEAADASETARASVKAWYDEVIAAAGPCDAATAALSESVEAIGSGGGTLSAYQAATRAKDQCLESFSRYGDIDPPAGASDAVQESAEDVVETCQMAHSEKRAAASTAAELFDGGMSNSRVTEFGERVQSGQSAMMACVAGAMKVATEVGIPIGELNTEAS